MLKQISPLGLRQMIEEPPDPVVFVKSLEYPEGLQFRGTIPSNISRDPPKIKLPALPDVRASSLRLIHPSILFVQFSCPERCRSHGICVHYQFVLGCRRCPDGLVCDTCCNAGTEKAIAAERVCPIHQDSARPKPVSSRPEDFLASQAQRQASHEILRRSVQNDWKDLNAAEEDDSDSEAEGSRGQREQTPKTLEDLGRMDWNECQLAPSALMMQNNFSKPTLPTIQEWVMTQTRQNTL